MSDAAAALNADSTAPTGTVALDAATYAPGATVTLTVNYTDPDDKATAVTVTLTDAAGNTVPLTATFSIADPVAVHVTDSLNHVWTKVTDNGAKAVFTAVA